MSFKKIRMLATVVFVLTLLLAFRSDRTVSAEVKQEEQLGYISGDQLNTGGVTQKSVRPIGTVEGEEEKGFNSISSTQVNAVSISRYSDNYGYNTLSDKGKKAYNALKKIGLDFHKSGKNAKKVYYSDGSGAYVTKKADISSYNVYIKDLEKIFFAFEADYPMLYWTNGVTYGYSGSKVTAIYLTVSSSYYSASTRSKVQSAIDKGLKNYCKQIDAMKAKGASNMDIELMVHDMLINKCSYAFDSYGYPEMAPWAHNIYGIFGKNKAVCQGYAKAFQLLMNYAGIDCIYAIGNGVTGGRVEGHAWNLVKLGGTWYGVDTTWDDAVNHVEYYFFNASTKLFGQTHLYDYNQYNEMYKIPAVSTKDTYWYYTYFKLKHSADPTLANVSATFKAALSKVEKTSQYWLRFVVPENYMSDFHDIVVYNEKAITNSLSSNGRLYKMGTYNSASFPYNPIKPWNFVYIGMNLYTVSNIKDNLTYFDKYQFKVTNTNRDGKSDITKQVTTSTQSGKLVISYKGDVIGRYSATAKSVQVSPIADVIYRGKAYKPKPVVKVEGVTLAEGTDYTLSYANNVNAGTGSVIITGKGNYMGKKTVKFNIKKLDLTGGTIAAVAPQAYAGNGIIPKLSITSAGGVKINAADYTITCKNNVIVGMASVTVTGKRNTFGTLTTSFQIIKRDINSSAVAKISNQNYTGKSKKPSITVKVGKKTLVKDVDYKVAYSDNKKPGRAKIVIKGIGANLTGTKTVYFNIVPKKVSGLKVSSKSRKVVVKWSKASYASGYKVYYATSKKGSYKSWGTTTAKSLTKKGLKKGKVYYVKVRPYKTINGKQQYGSDSKIIRIVVK